MKDPHVRYADGVRFRDLNGNGTMEPYEDPRRPVEERVNDLLGRMTLAEKAGLMFHTMMQSTVDGLYEPDPERPDEPPEVLSTSHLVNTLHINHFNATPRIAPGAYAQWHNRLQLLAAGTRLGIPVTLSTDPVHGFADNPATSAAVRTFSRWPEPLGLAAVGDPLLVAEFADVVRREYLAVGIRVALHPQADLGTEPRWSRVSGTFGADARLASRLVAAYIRGMQADTLGPDSVACVVKHFPGAGPQLRGDDAHFRYGREQVYPGGNAEYHLRPFVAAFEAGVAQVMPYYAIPVGLGVEEVGFCFNRDIITGWLRERLGFDGVVCSDWGLVTDVRVGGTRWPARGWGVEHLDRIARVEKVINAGGDQLGGEFCPELVVELVQSGRVTGERVDVSARRILRDKFRLGLFDDPYVDPEDAERSVGARPATLAGLSAQRRAITLLTNRPASRAMAVAPGHVVGPARGVPGPARDAAGVPVLPLRRGVKMLVDGVDVDVVSRYATVVDSTEDAEVALIRLAAPYEQRSTGIDYEAAFHQGRLDFPAEQEVSIVDQLRRVPSVVCIYLDRPAVIPGIAGAATAMLADFGATDEALLDVLFGEASPGGRLPMEMPSSMAAVEVSREDVPNDTGNPLFPAGHGLTY